MKPRPGTRIDVATDEFRGQVLVREDGPADGPVIVLLHGFCGSNGWFDRVVSGEAGLGEDLRVVRLDLAGHGGTGGRAVDAPAQARIVDAVLATLAIRRSTVVGHSFGADVAVELAEFSTRVDRLVIVCQAPDYSDARLPRSKVLMTGRVSSNVIHRTGKVAATGVQAVLRVRPPGDPARRLLANRALADFRALDTAMFRVVITDRHDRLAARPLDAQVRDAGKPTLVILGGNDHFYGDRSAPRYRAAGARVEIIAECGHSPLVEHPQLTANYLREFATADVTRGTSRA